MLHARAMSRAWAAASARTLARRLRRARQQERGCTWARALAERTATFREALAAHWDLSAALGAHFPSHGDALAAAALLRAGPSAADAELRDMGNWARHAPPPGLSRAKAVPGTGQAVSAGNLEMFRESIYAQHANMDVTETPALPLQRLPHHTDSCQCHFREEFVEIVEEAVMECTPHRGQSAQGSHSYCVEPLSGRRVAVEEPLMELMDTGTKDFSPQTGKGVAHLLQGVSVPLGLSEAEEVMSDGHASVVDPWHGHSSVVEGLDLQSSVRGVDEAGAPGSILLPVASSSAVVTKPEVDVQHNVVLPEVSCLILRHVYTRVSTEAMRVANAREPYTSELHYHSFSVVDGEFVCDSCGVDILSRACLYCAKPNLESRPIMVCCDFALCWGCAEKWRDMGELYSGNFERFEEFDKIMSEFSISDRDGQRSTLV